MLKKNPLERLTYEPPQISFIRVSQALSFLAKNFSMKANGDDWDDGDLLENELDDGVLGDEWNYGGGLGNS